MRDTLAQLWGTISGSRRRAEEAETKRRAEEAETKRRAEEAETKRRAEEAETKRRAEEAETKRQAEEAETKRSVERIAAAHRAWVADQPALARIALKKREVNGLDGDYVSHEQENAIKGLTDRVLLEKVARMADGEHLRVQAIRKLTDQEALKRLIKDTSGIRRWRQLDGTERQEDYDRWIKESAAERLSSLRTSAVEQLTNEHILLEIVKHESDRAVRDAAFARLIDRHALPEMKDLMLLAKVAADTRDLASAIAAIKHLIDPDIFSEYMRNCDTDGDRRAFYLKLFAHPILGRIPEMIDVRDLKRIVETVNDQAILAHIAKATCNYAHRQLLEVCKTAIEKISDHDVLLSIMKTTNDELVKIIADSKLCRIVKTVNDQEILAHIAKTTCAYKHLDPRYAWQHVLPHACKTAINKISDRDVLLWIIENTNNEWVKNDVNAKLLKSKTKMSAATAVFAGISVTDIDYKGG